MTIPCRNNCIPEIETPTNATDIQKYNLDRNH